MVQNFSVSEKYGIAAVLALMIMVAINNAILMLVLSVLGIVAGFWVFRQGEVRRGLTHRGGCGMGRAHGSGQQGGQTEREAVGEEGAASQHGGFSCGERRNRWDPARRPGFRCAPLKRRPYGAQAVVRARPARPVPRPRSAPR